MSTAAILWTHNEPDILEDNIRHLLHQVDEVYVLDRDSDEETRSILSILALQTDSLHLDADDGRYRHDQSAIMSMLALKAFEDGHQWVIPIDPDEVWYANGLTLSEFFLGLARDVGMVKAELYNHVATGEDKSKLSPFKGMPWRQRRPLHLPKVACRARPDLVIEGGNHSARVDGVSLTIGPSLVVRHFPYRSEDQFVEKVRSNYAELKKSDLSEKFGVHIRAYGRCLEEEGEETLRAHFRNWFFSLSPEVDDTLVKDPAPISRWEP